MSDFKTLLLTIAGHHHVSYNDPEDNLCTVTNRTNGDSFVVTGTEYTEAVLFFNKLLDRRYQPPIPVYEDELPF